MFCSFTKQTVAALAVCCVITLEANSAQAQTIARSDTHEASLSIASELCSTKLKVDVSLIDRHYVKSPITPEEFQKLIGALRIASQFECGNEPTEIYAVVRDINGVIQNLTSRASDGWTDRRSHVSNGFVAESHNRCEGYKERKLCVDVDVGNRNVPVNEETASAIIERYKKIASERGYAKSIHFAFRRGDFLVNHVVLKKLVSGYEYSYARLNKFMTVNTTLQKESDQKAEAAADDALSQILAAVNAETGAAPRPQDKIEGGIEIPEAFNLLAPTTLSCLTTFETADSCSTPVTRDGMIIGDNAGPVLLAEMSKDISGDTYSFFEIKAPLSPPTTDLEPSHTRYKKLISEQFEYASGFLEFDGTQVTVTTEQGVAKHEIKLIPAGADILSLPGYECFEAPSIGPGCFFLVHSERTRSGKHSFLFLAKAVPINSRGKDSWMPAIAAIARASSRSQASKSLDRKKESEKQIILANAEAIRRGKPKPYPAFDTASDYWKVVYKNLYDGLDFGGSYYSERQLNQQLYHTYHNQYAEICEKYIPEGSPIYEWIDDRFVGSEETANFDGSKTVTDYYEWYVRDRISIRSQYYTNFKKIADGFIEELRAEWLYKYPGPEITAFVDTSTPERNFIVYFNNVKNSAEMHNENHASFLKAEGCTSATTKKYERSLNKLILWK